MGSKKVLILIYGIWNLSYSQSDVNLFEKLSLNNFDQAYEKIDNIEDKEFFLSKFLKQAKNDNNIRAIIKGYEKYVSLCEHDQIKFISLNDSLIKFSKKIPDTLNPANSYLNKGFYKFKNRKLEEALDNYLMANQYAKKYYKKEFIFISNHMIGLLKDRIGFSDEALKMHRANLKFVKEKFSDSNNLILTTQSLHAIAFTYKNLRKLDSALYYNSLGMEQALNIGNQRFINHLLLNEGVINYYLKQLLKAEKNIQESLRYFKELDDSPNIAEGYFYLGKINYDKKKFPAAVNYFKKMDSIFLKTNDLLPEARIGYKVLIDHYHQNGSKENELYYLKKLIAFDSVINLKSKYLSAQIKNEFDIPNLLTKKQKLLEELDDEKNIIIYYSVVILSLLIFLSTLLYIRHIRLKRKVQKILKLNSETKVTSINNEKKTELDIPKAKVDEILNNIEIINKENFFLDSSITLVSLAKKIKTNSTYLSKTINYQYDKNFSQFINELRIEYAVKRLEADSKFRKYNISEIAKQSGFKSSETFSKVFKAKYSMYPSSFIKNI